MYALQQPAPFLQFTRRAILRERSRALWGDARRRFKAIIKYPGISEGKKCVEVNCFATGLHFVFGIINGHFLVGLSISLKIRFSHCKTPGPFSIIWFRCILTTLLTDINAIFALFEPICGTYDSRVLCSRRSKACVTRARSADVAVSGVRCRADGWPHRDTGHCLQPDRNANYTSC